MKEEDSIKSNQEIIGGIKSAIARGENLKEAMMTFYQAGYDKEEIEDAARAYLNEANDVLPEKRNIKTFSQEFKSINQNKKMEVNPKKLKEESLKNVQKVSNYLPPKKTDPEKGNKITIVLTLILLLLLGFLGALILFKDSLKNFLMGLI